MKVALIGATGFTGKALVRELLDRGHQVTAISRHPDQLDIRDPNLRAVAGDVLQADEVTRLVKGHDAVISAYNPGWSNPDIYNEFLEGARSIQAGVKASGVKRLITIGGAGSLELASGKILLDAPGFPEFARAGATAAKEYLGIIREEKDLDWTYFSPAILMNHEVSGTRRGSYRTSLDTPVFDDKGQSILSVEDLALVIVDELEHPKHIRQRFTAAY